MLDELTLRDSSAYPSLSTTETLPWLVTYPLWHGPARPVGAEPARCWAVALRQPLHRHTHFRASGQEVQGPGWRAAVLTSLTCQSLVCHLFGIWNAVSHKYHVMKSDKAPMLAHSADLTH